MHTVTLLLGFTSLVSQLPHSFAAHQQLPHQVYNVTAVEPPADASTAEPSIVTGWLTETATYTTIDIITTTATLTSTTTETTTSITTETTTETTTLPPPPPPISTLTVIYPSSDAAPVEVTSISQVITSFIPEATFCLGPALYFSSISGGPFTNGSANYTQYLTGTPSCSVEYSTTTKTICATTLTGLASKITVSECEQEITFSSECGYTLFTPPPPTPASTVISSSGSADSTASPLTTPAPTIRRLMTYWLAPWQSLTTLGSPPSDVDVKICTEIIPSASTQCQRYQEVWEIVPVTSTLTVSVPVTFSQTLEGPGALIFDSSTSFIQSTTEVVSLSKTLRLETQITGESTRVSPVPTATSRVTQRVTSTETVTRSLERVSSQR